MNTLHTAAFITVHPTYSFPHLADPADFKLITLWPFSARIAKLIHWIKYSRGLRLGKWAGEIAGHTLAESELKLANSICVPVPLHPGRRRERGFNQSELLGSEIAKALSIEFNSGMLRRIKNTRTQTHLSGAGRQLNVHNAFQVIEDSKVRERQILLVDDVCTTGATVNSCAHALLKAGAESILVIALARPEITSNPIPS